MGVLASLLFWPNWTDILRSDTHIQRICCVSVLEHQSILVQTSEMSTDLELNKIIFTLILRYVLHLIPLFATLIWISNKSNI